MKNNRILTQGEIYKILLTALREKVPTPPDGWSVVKLEKEIYEATKEYEPDPFVRQKDALETSIYYLIDFALRMPDRVDLSENTLRVREICEDLSQEIERITLKPDEVIKTRGKLKVWLNAILSVQTCLIYRNETDRFIAEQDKEKRRKQVELQKAQTFEAKKAKKNLSSLADKILKNTQAKADEQPTLF